MLEKSQNQCYILGQLVYYRVEIQAQRRKISPTLLQTSILIVVFGKVLL